MRKRVSIVIIFTALLFFSFVLKTEALSFTEPSQILDAPVLVIDFFGNKCTSANNFTKEKILQIFIWKGIRSNAYGDYQYQGETCNFIKDDCCTVFGFEKLSNEEASKYYFSELLIVSGALLLIIILIIFLIIVKRKKRRTKRRSKA